MEELLSKIEYDYTGSDEYISLLRNVAHKCLDESILNQLSNQLSGSKNYPYMVFKNLPFEIINSTPNINECSLECKDNHLSENIIAMFASIIGQPYSISFEGHDLVNNLIPFKKTKNEYTGLGSNVELDFHIENAALKFNEDGDFSPTALLLSAIRIGKDSYAKTNIACGRESIKLLDNNTVKVLRSNSFILKVPFRWRKSSSVIPEITNLIPAISGNDDYPTFHAAFYSDMMRGVTDEAQNALTSFHSAIKSVEKSMVIKPGELVFIDNRVSFHSRSKFDAKYDKNNRPYRWLQRVFISDSLWNFRKLKHNNRIFYPEQIEHLNHA